MPTAATENLDSREQSAGQARLPNSNGKKKHKKYEQTGSDEEYVSDEDIWLSDEETDTKKAPKATASASKERKPGVERTVQKQPGARSSQRSHGSRDRGAEKTYSDSGGDRGHGHSQHYSHRQSSRGKQTQQRYHQQSRHQIYEPDDLNWHEGRK